MHRGIATSAVKLVTGFKGIVALLALLALSTGVAWAGYRDTSYPVRVTLSTGSGSLSYAYGTMAGTRNTSDTISQFGCSVSGRDGYPGTPNNGMSVFCGATDASGRSLYCSSTNGSLAQAVSALSDDGYIAFYVDSNGKCVNVTTASYSNYQVKAF